MWIPHSWVTLAAAWNWVVASSAPQCPQAHPIRACSGPKSTTELLTTLADPAVYDLSLRPACGDGSTTGATVVEVQFHLMQLNNVNPKAGTVEINGYLRTWWKDPRLAFPSVNAGGCMDSAAVDRQNGPRLWRPDIFVDNLVRKTTTGMYDATTIFASGTVYRCEQVLLIVKISFDLARLPYDSHKVHFTLASYSQSSNFVRVIPKGGSVKESVSGIGITSGPMFNSVWDFPDADQDGIIETAGEFKEFENWDYTTLGWTIRRKAKFLIGQVVVPCLLFSVLSYVQFFVDSAAVPARSALAIVPVLIMITTSNSIYRSMPEGSQSMWLDDFVKTSIFLCNLAAVHFGFVQFFKLREKGRAAKLAGLLETKDVAVKLTNISKRDCIPLISLLDKFSPTEVDSTRCEDERQVVQRPEMLETSVSNSPKRSEEKPTAQKYSPTEDSPGGAFQNSTSKKVRRRSNEAVQANVYEADLVFLRYAMSTFNHFDQTKSGYLGPVQIRNILTYFNVYMSHEQAAKMACMYLTDHGHPAPLDDKEVRIMFSQVVGLLLHVNDYKTLQLDPVQGFKAYFLNIPPSLRFDIAARAIFPILVLFQILVFLILLNTVY